MKIAKPVTIDPHRAVPRTLPAGISGYVCLMLMALSSPVALAQVVTLQPGEYSRSIQVAPGSTHDVELRSPGGHICNWPSSNSVRIGIQRVSVAVLEEAESYGVANGEAIRLALNRLLGLGPGGRVSHITRSVRSNQRLESGQTELVIVFGDDCVEVGDARSALFQMRQVIRAHLGLPAPSSPPSATGNIR